MDMEKKCWVGFLHDSYGKVKGSLVLYDKKGPKLPDGFVCLYHFNRNKLVTYRKDVVRPKLSSLNKLEQSLIDALYYQVKNILTMVEKLDVPKVPDSDKITWIKEGLQSVYHHISWCLGAPYFDEGTEIIGNRISEAGFKSEEDEEYAELRAEQIELNAELSEDAESLQRSENEGWYYDDTDSDDIDSEEPGIY